MNSLRATTIPTPQGWQTSRPDGNSRIASGEARTLDRRLAEGRLPVAEALRCAMSLADALRKLHETGRVHGSLTPSTVELTPSGVNLLPPLTAQGLVTPYTAPETLRGRPADARSDIFSFGAVVYEMVTGRWPFEANTPEALAAAILNAPAAGTGNPGLDGLLANCLAKDPEARWQRMQKAQMELRLLGVSARRVESSPRRENVEALVRAEVQQALEARFAGRLEAQSRSVAELQQAVTASLQAVQAQLCTVDAKLAAAQERAGRGEEGAAEMHRRVSALEQDARAPQERVARVELLMETAVERITRTEHAVEAGNRQAVEFAQDATIRVHALEQTVSLQAEALEAARRALAQTDDLVERVVEALDSLQSIVLERSEERSPAVN